MSNKSKQRLLDERLEALGRLERRRLLLELSASDPYEEPCIDLDRLDRNPGELDPLVAMRHLHLPVLEERGFIRWDRENDGVTKGPRFHEMEPLLQALREVRDELPDRWM